MKIALFSAQKYDQDYFDRYNPGHEISYFVDSLNEVTVSFTKGYDAVCLFVNDEASSAVLKILNNNGVKLILLRCAGYNNVDIKAATAFNIPVLRVPAYSPEAVAEHALALVLTLNRKTHKAYNRVREGNFSLDKLLGFNLHNCKVAVIGTGNIGKAFCKIMMGFGCKITAYDIYEDPTLAESGVIYGTLEDTLAEADIVSLHCPLMDSTRHMINEKTLKLFKEGAMLINTSRGGLVNTVDVIEGLKAGQLGYLGLDVYEHEDDLFFHDYSEDIIHDDLITRLISFPNVLITSHQGFFTHEAMEQITTTTYNNAAAFLDNGELVNRVIK